MSLIFFFFKKLEYNEDDFVLIERIPQAPPFLKINDSKNRYFNIKIKYKFKNFLEYQKLLLLKKKRKKFIYKKKKKKRLNN